MNPVASFGAVCRMIKIEHSVFALPFAYVGAFMVAGGFPDLRSFLLLTIAMVAVRSFAMAVNRVVDLRFDAANPRTQMRPLVTGEISVVQTWVFVGIMAIIFIGACWGINQLCFMLSPVALVVSALYSLLKRFTWLCHFWLGGVLALAPIAGAISVTPEFTLSSLVFSLGIVFWVAGFDIIYSCQDVTFDSGIGLHSVPQHFGVSTALVISSFCHVNTSLFFLLAGAVAGLGWSYYLVWAGVSAVLLWEHTIVSADDLSRANTAFFTLNGIISPAMCIAVWVSL